MIEKRLLRNLDFSMMATVMAIMVFGLVVIGSATQAYLAGSSDPYLFVKKQAAWIVVGWLAIFLVLTGDYTAWQRYAGALYGLSLALLAAVLVVGKVAMGAQRWIGFPHPTSGPLQIQPAEFAKLALIITLANHLARKEKVETWADFVSPLAHVGLPLLLVFAQPDLGTSLVFIGILVGMLFMAGAPVTKLGIIFGGGLAAAVGLVFLHFHFGLPLPLKDYQLMRLIVFVNPEVDRLGAGYHIIQSKIAIGHGGLLGKGLFYGTQNQLNFLPEQHTDFIFSVVGEELGFVGGATLLVLFLLLLWRGIRVAVQAKDQFGVLLATGVVSMILFHVLVNVGMTIGVMPVTGIPLPFVSYGGSSLLTNAVAVGILLNVYMRRQKIMF